MRTIAILLVLGVASTSVAQLRPRIAVMPLKAKRIQRDIVSIMDALLVSQVSRLGQFDVISAADIQAMLEAEGMKDALGCNEVTCAAEIGGALNARSTLAGTVGKLGSTIVINLTLFDNEKMTALRRANVEVKNDEDKFSAAVRGAVEQLFGADVRAPLSAGGVPAAELFQEPGHLEVISSPPGAFVIVDGRLAGKTPIRVGLQPGPHQLNVEMKNRIPYAYRVRIDSNESELKEVVLGDLSSRKDSSTYAALSYLTLGLGIAAVLGGTVGMIRTGSSSENRPMDALDYAGLFGVLAGMAITLVGGVMAYAIPPPPPAPRYLHKIDKLERLSATDDRHRQRGLSLAFQF